MKKSDNVQGLANSDDIDQSECSKFRVGGPMKMQEMCECNFGFSPPGLHVLQFVSGLFLLLLNGATDIIR